MKGCRAPGNNNLGGYAIRKLFSSIYVLSSKNGFEVVSIDNNSRSSDKSLDGIEQITGQRVKNYKIDLVDEAATFEVLKMHSDAIGIIHFAAYKSVPESVEKPLMYYENNLTSLLNILKGAKAYGIRNVVFSSSCSVYGNADELPVTEKTPLKEVECPYAATKVMGEMICKDAATVHPSWQS